MNRPTHILIAASEANPLARTSFMGDVVAALPLALRRQGIQASLIIPRYRSIPTSFHQELVMSGITSPVGDKHVQFDVYRTELGTVPVYLIDQPEYFDREGIYGDDRGEFLDNAERFIFFSRAIIDLLPYYPDPPDIIHCNDWQTGLSPLYLKLFQECQTGYRHVRSLFTVHNLAYQGLFWRFDMHLTCLPWDYFTPDGIEFYGDLNLLKAGLLYSDAINTVSPAYCREILSETHGCGLDGVLRATRSKLHGILNGADYETWSPDKNPFIPQSYSLGDPSGKNLCKQEVLKSLKLDVEADRPLITMIAPLYTRKGADLLEQSLESMITKGCQVVLQGEGDKNYQKAFIQLAETYGHSFAFLNNFDQDLSHKLIAGSDLLLKPSRYEPCGLIQLYALKFGTIPIAHRTGGLDDTIIDESDSHRGPATGFKFDHYTPESLLSSLDRALDAFNDPVKWSALVKSAMKQDYSWDKAAAEYINLYRQIVSAGS